MMRTQLTALAAVLVASVAMGAGSAVPSTATLTGASQAGPPGKGISCDFGIVTLNNIPQGRPFRLDARPVRLFNGSDASLDLKFEPAVPSQGELITGFEPIPDAGWVTFDKTDFRGVKPGRSAVAVMSLLVPDKPEYAGRAYQVSLHLHTAYEKPGMAFGLKPAVCFRVASQGMEVSSAPAVDVPIKVEPPEIRGATGFKLWMPCQPLKVENPSREEMLLELGITPEGPAGTAPARPGYEPMPSGIELRCNPKTLVLAGNSADLVDVYALIPADTAYSGKKYQGTLYSRVKWRGTTLNLVNVVLLDVPKLQLKASRPKAGSTEVDRKGK